MYRQLPTKQFSSLFVGARNALLLLQKCLRPECKQPSWHVRSSWGWSRCFMHLNRILVRSCWCRGESERFSNGSCLEAKMNICETCGENVFERWHCKLHFSAGVNAALLCATRKALTCAAREYLWAAVTAPQNWVVAYWFWIIKPKTVHRTPYLASSQQKYLLRKFSCFCSERVDERFFSALRTLPRCRRVLNEIFCLRKWKQLN